MSKKYKGPKDYTTTATNPWLLDQVQDIIMSIYQWFHEGCGLAVSSSFRVFWHLPFCGPAIRIRAGKSNLIIRMNSNEKILKIFYVKNPHLKF